MLGKYMQHGSALQVTRSTACLRPHGLLEGLMSILDFSRLLESKVSTFSVDNLQLKMPRRELRDHLGCTALAAVWLQLVCSHPGPSSLVLLSA